MTPPCATCGGSGWDRGSTCIACIHLRPGFAEKWAPEPTKPSREAALEAALRALVSAPANVCDGCDKAATRDYEGELFCDDCTEGIEGEYELTEYGKARTEAAKLLREEG